MTNKIKRISLGSLLAIGLLSMILYLLFNNLISLLFWIFFYWWFWIFYVIFLWNYGYKATFTLKVAFTLFISSGLAVSINLLNLGEFLMRTSLLLWIIGLIQSLIEYKRSKNGV